ncbi:MAG: aminopeptidase [Acidiferrobacter sp.]
MPRKVLSPVRHCSGFLIILLTTLGSLSGCALPYYAQAASGELAILRHERPITQVLARPTTPAAVKNRLLYVLRVRRFAQQQLDLPLHGNYRDYVNLHRPYAVWNVFAARPLSLTLKHWCFPIIGCVAYRGYFAEARAYRYAHRLQQQGYDVFVGGVPAYATLDYLHDPVLSTFLGASRGTIAHMIFHELSHDLIFIPNATTFDESFADTVAGVGVRRFLKAQGTPAERRRYAQEHRRRKEVAALMNACRARLKRLYRKQGMPRAERLREKRADYRALAAGFAALSTRWHGNHGFGAFFHQGFNNAILGAYVSYESLVPAFQRLLTLENGNLPAFFRAVRWYGRLPSALRDRALKSRHNLVSRLPALHEAQIRSTIPVHRSRLLGLQRPRLARPIQHGMHNQA